MMKWAVNINLLNVDGANVLKFLMIIWICFSIFFAAIGINSVVEQEINATVQCAILNSFFSFKQCYFGDIWKIIL